MNDFQLIVVALDPGPSAGLGRSRPVGIHEPRLPAQAEVQRIQTVHLGDAALLVDTVDGVQCGKIGFEGREGLVLGHAGLLQRSVVRQSSRQKLQHGFVGCNVAVTECRNQGPIAATSC